jgi:hypothetical protein
MKSRARGARLENFEQRATPAKLNLHSRAPRQIEAALGAPPSKLASVKVAVKTAGRSGVAPGPYYPPLVSGDDWTGRVTRPDVYLCIDSMVERIFSDLCIRKCTDYTSTVYKQCSQLSTRIQLPSSSTVPGTVKYRFRFLQSDRSTRPGLIANSTVTA